MKTATELGMSGEKLRIIRIAGELHDIGEIGVPESIVRKTGRLSADKLDRMRIHLVRGACILEPPAVFESVLLTAPHHHE